MTVDVNASTTVIGVIWGQVENEVLITWHRTSSQCTDKSESFKNHSLSHSPSYMIPDLKEITEYNVTVCINGSICDSSIVTTNEAGMFISHNTLNLHILFSAPSAAPEDIKLKGASSTSITVMWGPVPCDYRNGNITGYVVMYRIYGGGVFRNETNKESTMEFTINGLEPSTEYEIKVAAFTVAVGPFTDESLIASSLGTCVATTPSCV